jgi:glycosyltransferase involved in cell wall biosynthesis
MTGHILHISTARGWRGGEQQIAYLCLELKKLGQKQSIACIKDAPLHHWAKKNNIPVLALKKVFSLDLRFSAKLSYYTKAHKVDIWHAHDAHAHGFAVYAKQFWTNPVKLIVSRRVDFPVGQSWFSAFKYNHPSVHKYLCVSDAIAEIMRESLKKNDAITTVHSAIDAGKFKHVEKGVFRLEFAKHAAKYWVGTTAALTGHKDLFTFLDTAKRLMGKQAKYHFFIAGKGELEAELKSYSAKLGLENDVTFLGFRQDVAQLLADLDCFLFTSEMEGLGTSILDAFASNIPVVATQAGGIPEMVIHQKTGLLAPVKDAKCLAAHVESIRNNALLKNELCKAAAIHLLNFSPSELALKTLAEYRA